MFSTIDDPRHAVRAEHRLVRVDATGARVDHAVQASPQAEGVRERMEAALEPARVGAQLAAGHEEAGRRPAPSPRSR